MLARLLTCLGCGLAHAGIWQGIAQGFATHLGRTIGDHFVGTVRGQSPCLTIRWMGVAVGSNLLLRHGSLLMVRVLVQGFTQFTQAGEVQQTSGLPNEHVNDFVK
jgi:hypothetical protein